ncbi:MAG: PAS domain S-box protein [Panacagrimonas sp.]
MSTATTASTDRLDALLDAAVDSVVLVDGEGCITRFNRAAERLFGYSASEVVGHNVNILMSGEHDGHVNRFLETGKRRIIGISREVTACRHDGSTFPMELSVGEFLSGTEHGFVGVLRDISERKKQEALLRQTAQELRLMFEQAPTPIAVTDLAGRVQTANAACLQFLGNTAQSIRRLRLSDIVDTADRAAVLSDFEQLRNGAETRQREVSIRHSDGHNLPILLYSACARDADGKPLLYIAEMIDRRALHEATREAQALRDRLAHAARLGTLGEMVSSIAHEVNQPLTAINNYASACRRMLLSGQTTHGELVEVLEKISRQAERAGQVIRGLRSMIRQGEPEREPQDLNALVEDVSRLVEIDLRGTSERLVLELASGLPRFVGDGVQIQQVVMNLIRNGLEAMRECGMGEDIRVSTQRAADGWLEIVVADQGPGLAPNIEARLFDPFVTTKPQGMGLGLSICKSIVHTHGGEMSYRRGAAGGADFVVRLPAVQPDDEEQDG